MSDVDHRGLRIFDRSECFTRLASVQVGRVGFTQDDLVIVLPVNFVLHRGCVCIRTTWGSKLQAAISSRRVCFEVDDFRSEARAGWSVLAQTSPVLIEDRGVRRELEQLGDVSWAPDIDNHFWIALRIEDVSGREILPSPPDGDRTRP